MTQWRLNQLAVIISAGFIFGGFTLILPFLPLYIQMLGVQSPSQAALWAGIVLGVSPLIAALIGTRRTFIVTGFLCLLSLFLFVLIYRDKERSALPEKPLETQPSGHLS